MRCSTINRLCVDPISGHLTIRTGIHESRCSYVFDNTFQDADNLTPRLQSNVQALLRQLRPVPQPEISFFAASRVFFWSSQLPRSGLTSARSTTVSFPVITEKYATKSTCKLKKHAAYIRFACGSIRSSEYFRLTVQDQNLIIDSYLSCLNWLRCL